jgi:hypothetical protein
MYTSVVTVKVQEGLELAADHHGFWEDYEILLFADDRNDAQALLTNLTYKVSLKPKDLLTHLRRIYCCYQNRFTIPLYAALLDLLIVLNGKGQQLSLRLISGCSSRLEPRFFSALKTAYKFPERLPSNSYSLFATGHVGSTHLVDYSHHGHVERDFLTLAHDYIEYSQLNEAMEILEQGLQIEPEHRDAQSVLLQLYKSTDSRDRFSSQYQLLLDSKAMLIEGWLALQQFFDGKQP